jgi:hypothetical protein
VHHHSILRPYADSHGNFQVAELCKIKQQPLNGVGLLQQVIWMEACEELQSSDDYSDESTSVTSNCENVKVKNPYPKSKWR